MENVNTEGTVRIKNHTDGSQELWAALNRMTSIMEQQMQGNGAREDVRHELPQINPQKEFDLMLDRFVKLGPPVFKGQPDADIAEKWTMQMEKIFATLRGNDTNKTIIEKGPEYSGILVAQTIFV